jgi:acyl-CoA thioester hydrolase
MVDGGTDLVVAEANIRYRKPLRFDEEFDAILTVETLGETSMIVAVELARGEETVTEGTLRYVVIDPKAGAKMPMPDALRESLSRFLA